MLIEIELINTGSSNRKIATDITDLLNEICISNPKIGLEIKFFGSDGKIMAHGIKNPVDSENEI